MSDGASEIRAWLVGWFEQRGAIVPRAEGLNFISAGLIDSFGVIELIEAIETRFGIQFEQDQFQDLRFPILEGMVAIIGELKGAK